VDRKIVNLFFRVLIVVGTLSYAFSPMPAQAQDRCFVLCAPDMKIEPTFSWENFYKAPRIAETNEQGETVVRKAERERVSEMVFAIGIPTTIPRVEFTFETIVKPFVKGTSPELETELNIEWLRSDDTGGWVSSHFDIIDKYSPGGRPHNSDRYSHKLNLELDTAFAFLKWTKKPWLSDLEIEGSLDYVATGLPRAGDRFGDTMYLDNASRWSFSLVFVFPLAPLR
jgi:hypothetical protein